MATHCKMAALRGSSERQNALVVRYFGTKKGSCQFQTKNIIRVITCKVCLFSLLFVKYIIFMT